MDELYSVFSLKLFSVLLNKHLSLLLQIIELQQTLRF